MAFDELTTQNWINLAVSAGVIFLVVVMGRTAIRRIAGIISTRITARTRTDLDDLLLDAIHLPLYWFIVALITDVMIRRLTFLPESWNDALGHVFFSMYFIAGFVLAWRLVAGVFEWYAREMTADADDPRLATGLVRFFQRVALIVVGIIGLIILLGHFSVDITGLVATLGVGSLAFALAAQAAFEDTISGFIIMVDQPFRVGDRIEIVDLGTWGDVVDIGLRSARIRTVENRMVIVPNSVMGKSLIVNHSYPDEQYRIETSVGVAYGTDLERVRGVIASAIEGLPGVVKDRPVEVLFMEFGDSSLNFRVFWWIQSYVDTLRAQNLANSAIYDGLNAAGIEIPFPQRDVNLRLSTDELARLARAVRGDGTGPLAG